MSKLASSTCRAFEHEMFYTSYGIDRLSLQSEIAKPILRAKCDYKQSNVCLQPLLHSMDTSNFESFPSDMWGHKHNTANKMNLHDRDYLAYLNTCSGSGDSRVCLVAEDTDDDGHLVTSDNLKLIFNFPSTTLIQGMRNKKWMNPLQNCQKCKEVNKSFCKSPTDDRQSGL